MSETKSDYGSQNIVRVQKDARYFVASNVPFNDERLSWEARGVMGYLLSKPNDWETRMSDLVNHGPAGMKMIRRILAELRRAGYMSRKRVQVAHGEFRWITTLYESPELNKSSMLPLGIDGPGIDAQGVDIVSTELLNTKELYIDKIAKKIDELKFYFNPNTGTIINIWKEWFADDVIIRALEMSRGKSISYADKILIGWKANGVPPTREQQIESARKAKGNQPNGQNTRPAQEPTKADIDIARQILAARAQPSRV